MSDWEDFIASIKARVEVVRENGGELHLSILEADTIRARAGFDPFVLFGVPVVLDV